MSVTCVRVINYHKDTKPRNMKTQPVTSAPRGATPPLAKVITLALNSGLVEKKDRLQKLSAVDINSDLD